MLAIKIYNITMYLRIKALALVRNSASFYFYLVGTDTCLYFIVFKCIKFYFLFTTRFGKFRDIFNRTKRQRDTTLKFTINMPGNGVNCLLLTVGKPMTVYNVYINVIKGQNMSADVIGRIFHSRFLSFVCMYV